MKDLLTGLWQEVFGEPPPLADDSGLLTRVLVENLPPAPPYQPLDLRPFTRRGAGPADVQLDNAEEGDEALIA